MFFFPWTHGVMHDYVLWISSRTNEWRTTLGVIPRFHINPTPSWWRSQTTRGAPLFQSQSPLSLILSNFFKYLGDFVVGRPPSLLHIVPFCEGPNKKSEGFAKEKQITWRVCEGKKICQLCDAERIATCGAPLIANLEWTFNHHRTFARYTTNKTLRSAQSLSTVAIFHPSQRLIILKTS